MYMLADFLRQPGFENWATKMWHRACLNEQFIRQHMKNKTIFFNKWLSTAHLDAQVPVSPLPVIFHHYVSDLTY